ncbi:MAG: hypothetical protein CMP57_00665 [Flavobacteriales bacterium]|nr:hypothetical protein [Flavobacteriales bacterium]|tara:strand:+ start:366 stop:887 length:522 start_codon:yes stop_codon:yes gene_type:complete
MNVFLEYVNFILPSVLIMIVAFYMLNRVLKHDHTRRVFEYKKSVAKEVIPLRMQAYERLALFLERMQPTNLLLRVQQKNMKSMSLHAGLMQTIRSEYDHNMSQQVYVSNEVWLLINQAKNQLINVINEQVPMVDPKSDAMELGSLIILASKENKEWLIDEALIFLKNELRENY